jgi:hypothetical protein
MDTTGFAVVLYSRLHLVVYSRKTLHLVLAMIVIDAVLFHTPMIIFLMGLSMHKDWDPYVTPFEYTQVVGFSIQETVISCIYIRKTAKFLKAGYSTRARKVMTMLIAVQVLVVLMDIVLLVIDCIGMFTLKAVLHPFAYGIKLKIEFAVLNLLLNLVKHGSSEADFFGAPGSGGGDGGGGGGGGSSDRDSASTLPAARSSNRWSWFRNVMDRKEGGASTAKTDIRETLDFNVTWQDTRRDNSGTIDHPLPSPPPAALAPKVTRLDAGSTLQGDVPEKSGDVSIDDVERQYLGRFGFR